MPSTFRPESLLSTDFLKTLPHPFSLFYRVPLSQPAKTSLAHQHIGASIAWGNTTPPKPCSGFLYYHKPDGPASYLAGSLRFRLTPDFEPTSETSPRTAFAAGSDLPIPDAGGLPWSLPVWTLAARPALRPACAVLTADGFRVPDSMMSFLKSMKDSSLALYALGQPFLIEFHMPAIHAWVLPPSSHFRNAPLAMRIGTGFADLASKRFPTPYEGLGIMTLERLADGSLVTRLQKIFWLSQVYANHTVAEPVEGMTRALHVAPVLFKEATKSTAPKYRDAQQAAASLLSCLPHISELGLAKNLTRN
ncbi:hypothetical protein C8R44DRAFT_863914 [Mycena epipterygia]|nr:hypothetical protein C8R44DRAFT_863914 [Mycena epipterygia]